MHTQAHGCSAGQEQWPGSSVAAGESIQGSMQAGGCQAELWQNGMGVGEGKE